MQSESLVLGASAFLLTAFFGFLASPVARALDLFDRPDEVRKFHDRPVPLIGGLMVFAGMALASSMLGILHGLSEHYLRILLLASAIAFAVGVVDDRRHIRPSVRLVLLGLIGVVAMTAEPALVVRALDSGLFGFHQGLGPLALPLSAVALLALQNALNMVDGMDGLFTGLVLIYLAALAPWAAEVAVDALPLMVALAATLFSILAFNLRGKLFMGDSGSYALAVFLGLLTIYVYNEADGEIPGEVIALWFGIPVVDMGRLMIQRIRIGRNPFEPDREHFHHLLQELMPNAAVLATYWSLVAAPAIIVAIQPASLPMAIALGLFGYIGLVVIAYRARRRDGRGFKISLINRPQT